MSASRKLPTQSQQLTRARRRQRAANALVGVRDAVIRAPVHWGLHLLAGAFATWFVTSGILARERGPLLIGGIVLFGQLALETWWSRRDRSRRTLWERNAEVSRGALVPGELPAGRPRSSALVENPLPLVRDVSEYPRVVPPKVETHRERAE